MVMHTKLLSSPSTPLKSIGGITAVGDAEATIDDDQIIVHVDGPVPNRMHRQK